MTHNQEFIQSLMDEGEYAPMYPFISTSNLSDFQKILVSHMMNDIRMNSTITWKHATYASKMNASRKGILKQFKLLKEVGILLADNNNKVGSKNNKFTISFSAISDYKPVTEGTKPVTEKDMLDDDKPVTDENKPVTDENKPVTEGTKPVTEENQTCNPSGHIKKSKEINKEINKEIIKEETFDDTFFDDVDIDKRYHFKPKQEVPKQEVTEEDLDKFLAELDI